MARLLRKLLASRHSHMHCMHLNREHSNAFQQHDSVHEEGASQFAADCMGFYMEDPLEEFCVPQSVLIWHLVFNATVFSGFVH